MTPTTQQLADAYYDAFRNGTDFSEISFATQLKFKGPIHQYDDGERYRADCVRLAGALRGLEIRQQYIDGNRVHSVYDFDLGLPSGPIASAETLIYENGSLVEVELILDATPLRAAAS